MGQRPESGGVWCESWEVIVPQRDAWGPEQQGRGQVPSVGSYWLIFMGLFLGDTPVREPLTWARGVWPPGFVCEGPRSWWGLASPAQDGEVRGCGKGCSASWAGRRPSCDLLQPTRGDSCFHQMQMSTAEGNNCDQRCACNAATVPLLCPPDPKELPLCPRVHPAHPAPLLEAEAGEEVA